MEIFNIGTAEFFIIFLLALIILGPRRLPEYAAKFGKMVRNLRNMSQGFLLEWQRELAVATRIDELEETRRELQEAQYLLRETKTTIINETNQVTMEANQAVARATQAASLPPQTTETIETTDKLDIPPQIPPDPSAEAARPASTPVEPEEWPQTIKPPASPSNGSAPHKESVNE